MSLDLLGEDKSPLPVKPAVAAVAVATPTPTAVDQAAWKAGYDAGYARFKDALMSGEIEVPDRGLRGLPAEQDVEKRRAMVARARAWANADCAGKGKDYEAGYRTGAEAVGDLFGSGALKRDHFLLRKAIGPVPWWGVIGGALAAGGGLVLWSRS